VKEAFAAKHGLPFLYLGGNASPPVEFSFFLLIALFALKRGALLVSHVALPIQQRLFTMREAAYSDRCLSQKLRPRFAAKCKHLS